MVFYAKIDQIFKPRRHRVIISPIIITYTYPINPCILKRTYPYRLTRQLINQTERRTTKTIFLICFSYVFITMPYLIFQSIFFMETSNAEHELEFSMPKYILYQIVNVLYWFNVSCNIYFYVASNSQYRQALIFTLKNVSFD